MTWNYKIDCVIWEHRDALSLLKRCFPCWTINEKHIKINSTVAAGHFCYTYSKMVWLQIVTQGKINYTSRNISKIIKKQSSSFHMHGFHMNRCISKAANNTNSLQIFYTSKYLTRSAEFVTIFRLIVTKMLAFLRANFST